jgi:hypothetical protein
MEYLSAIYRIEKRRDDYPSIPLRDLIDIGHLSGIELSHLSLPHTRNGKREILVEHEVNAKLVAAVPKPMFVNCKTDIFFVGTDYGVGALLNAFGPLPGAVCQSSQVEARDWCDDNGVSIARQVGPWLFFEDDGDATLFKLRFGK